MIAVFLRATQDTAEGGMRTQAHGNGAVNELKLKCKLNEKESYSYVCAGLEVVRSTMKKRTPLKVSFRHRKSANGNI